MKKNESTDLKKMSQPTIKVSDPAMPSRPDQEVQNVNSLTNKPNKQGTTMAGARVGNQLINRRLRNNDNIKYDKKISTEMGQEEVNDISGPNASSNGALIINAKDPKRMAAISNGDPRTNVHEGNHVLTRRLINKYGTDKISKMYDTALSHVDPKLDSHLSEILQSRGYEEGKTPDEQLGHKEERLNLIRDLISPGEHRDSWYEKHGTTPEEVQRHTQQRSTLGDQYQYPENVSQFLRNDSRAKQNWKNIVNHIKGYSFKKSEEIKTDLTKGSFQRKNKYDPRKEMSQANWQTARDWVGDADQDARDEYPQIKDGGKNRAIQKLASRTKSKLDENGVRHYLLHRGMGHEEHSSNIKDSHYHGGQSKSSWTPNYQNASTHNGITVSAWVPEHDIHAVPEQHGMARQKDGVFDTNKMRSNSFKTEKEIILNHSKPYRLANDKHISEVKNSFTRNFPNSKLDSINDKINSRGNPRTQEQFTPEKIKEERNTSLGKSELLIFNDLIKNIDIYEGLSKDEINLLVDNVLEKNQATRLLRGLGLGVTLVAGANYMAPQKQPVKAPEQIEQVDRQKKYFLDRVNKLGYRANVNDINSHINSKSTPFAQNSVLDAKTLYDGFPSSPTLKRSFQDSHYNYLKNQFKGDQDQMAHAWKNGIENTNKAINSNQNVSDLDSTLRFNSVPNEN